MLEKPSNIFKFSHFFIVRMLRAEIAGACWGGIQQAPDISTFKQGPHPRASGMAAICPPGCCLQWLLAAGVKVSEFQK